MCGGGGSSSGVIDTEIYRDHYRKIRDAFDQMAKERGPIMENYERMALESLDTLIGNTVPGAQEAFRTASTMQEMWQKNWAPAMEQYMKDAAAYDTPERRAMERQRVMTEIGMAGEQARSNALAKLEGFGIDPSQTRSAGMDANLRTQTALAQAAAANKSDQDVEARGLALRESAIGMGDDLVDQGLASAELGGRLAGMGLGGVNSTAYTMGSLLGTETSLLGNKAAMVDKMLQAKQAEQQSKVGTGTNWAGIGQAVGTIGGAALGAFGGPAGMMAGAQLGGMLGGAAGGLAGGGQTAQPAVYGGIDYSKLPSTWSTGGTTASPSSATIVPGGVTSPYATGDMTGQNLNRFG
jgi:hypothetical protein